MAHVELQLSEEGGNFAFQRIRDAFEINVKPSDKLKIGPLTLQFLGGRGHLENGEFRIGLMGPDYKAQIKELDLVWNSLSIAIGLDVPKACVGGFCILSIANNCVIYVPKVCLFEADPDIEVVLDLAGVRHEISSAFSLSAKKEADVWNIRLNPDKPLDIDWIDPAGMAKAAFDRLIAVLIDGLFGGLPNEIKEVLEKILGAFSDLVEALLDFHDDVIEWISEKIGFSLGIDNIVISLLLEYFYESEPIAAFDDPYEIMPAEDGLPAVTSPIREAIASILSDRLQFGLVFEA
jgi:hypothetical protein